METQGHNKKSKPNNAKKLKPINASSANIVYALYLMSSTGVGRVVVVEG
jgi:hypothetical protein